MVEIQIKSTQRLPPGIQLFEFPPIFATSDRTPVDRGYSAQQQYIQFSFAFLVSDSVYNWKPKSGLNYHWVRDASFGVFQLRGYLLLQHSLLACSERRKRQYIWTHTCSSALARRYNFQPVLQLHFAVPEIVPRDETHKLQKHFAVRRQTCLLAVGRGLLLPLFLHADPHRHVFPGVLQAHIHEYYTCGFVSGVLLEGRQSYHYQES